MTDSRIAREDVLVARQTAADARVAREDVLIARQTAADARVAREDVLVARQTAADTRVGRMVVLVATIDPGGAMFDADVAVTIELGFNSGPFAATPSWVDVSQYVRAANWRRGRNSVVGDFPAGFGSIQLDNTDGRFYSWNTSSPYSPNVTVGVPIRIRATHLLTTTYTLFRGYVRSWNNPSPHDEELITVPFVETYTRLNDRQIQTAMAAASSDVRVGDILDAAGWPAAWRDLDAGVGDVAAITPDKSAVFLLRAASQAEQGEVFQDATGNVRFRNRLASSPVSSLATFGPSGSDLTYVDIGVDFDDDFLYNEALVTGAVGEQQEASDATSIADHGAVTFPPVANESIVGEPAALNVAEWIVGKHKTIGPRITSFVVDPAADPDNLWPQVLGRDLRDVVTVNVDYDGTAVDLSQIVAIESIGHAFDAVSSVWTVTYGCHPVSALEQTDFWILGTDALDTGTVLA